MTPGQRRKEILERFLREVWSDGDVDASSRFLAPSYTIHHDPGDPWDGKTLDPDEYQQRVRVSRAPCPDQRFVVREMFADGDAVVATWTWTGTHLGELAGFPPTGRTLAMSGATVYYFDGDRIAGHWQQVDRLGVFRQLAAAAGRT